jgi:subtilisin family serine protease
LTVQEQPSYFVDGAGVAVLLHVLIFNMEQYLRMDLIPTELVSFVSLRTICACICFFLFVTLTSNADNSSMPLFKPGELIVKFHRNTEATFDESGRAAVRRQAGATLNKRLNLTGLEVWRLDDPNADVQARANELSNDPRIEYATPNHYLRLLNMPDDPMFGHQWALHNTGQSNGTADADIDAPEAWDLSTGGEILVAVIDTGVNYLHEDLRSQMWRNPGEIPNDGIDNEHNGYIDDVYGIDTYDKDSDPMDDDGHGSHCAGIIGAAGNNATGVVGICWQVKIMACDFFDPRGWGEEDDAIECIEYCITKGVRVINASWGGDPYNQALYDAIEIAGESNILFCAGAGNDGNDNDVEPFYPSSYSNESLIAIAATDRNDELAGFSCWGSNTVDLSAPGVDILNTFLYNEYVYKNGTSMATPHVTGAAALLLSLDPSLHILTVKDAILKGTDPVPAMTGKAVTGGRLNVFTAMLSLSPLVRYEDPVYFPGRSAGLMLFDTNRASQSTGELRLMSDSGDSEVITVHERSAADGIFTGSVSLADLPVTVSNGVLEVRHGDMVYAVYYDALESRSITGTAYISMAMNITVTSVTHYVSYEGRQFAAAGILNGPPQAQLVVSNMTTGESHPFAANGPWQAPAVELVPGLNSLVVSGTNTYGFPDTASAEIILCGPRGSTNFVSESGTHQWPFTSPASAATSLHAAIEASFNGNQVRVSAGTWPSGGITIDKPVILKSAAGAASTVITGMGQKRCFVLSSPAVIDGFSIAHGFGENGGGIYMTDGTLVNCIIVSNIASRYGGGVYSYQDSLVSNCTILANTAERGAGLYSDYGSLVTECIISNNMAADRGGGAYCFNGRVYHSLITGNLASNRAGGVYCYRNGTVYHSTISGNISGQQGGGAYMVSGFADGCIIYGNQAKTQGGGIYCGKGSAVRDSILYDNYSGLFGGGIYSKFGDVINCTVSSNDCKYIGGGVFVDPGDVYNTVMYYNTADQGENFYSVDGEFHFCCSIPAPDGPGHITNKPHFVQGDIHNYHLRASSACIDAGSNGFVFTAMDADGNPRIIGGTVDMGAYEFESGPLACYLEGDTPLGPPDLAVTFTSEVWGVDTEGLYYLWDFGADGHVELQGSNAWTAQMTYTNEGKYSVRLTVRNAGHEVAVMTRTDYIRVIPEPGTILVLLLLAGATTMRKRYAW